jgi:acetylornithine deacetylase
MKLAVQSLPHIDVALIGEPTGMQPAVAEKGLMVLDFTVHGKAGHAARNEGINALYRATELIEKLRVFKFDKVSDLLGPVKFTITMINAGTQHNVIPDTCTFTADVRTNELYSNREVFEIISSQLPEWCEVKARSFNLNSSRIDVNHRLIRKCVSIGLRPFGSPTLSDQAVLDCPSFKLGPGDSARSHTADEYILLTELEQAVPKYLELLDGESIAE